MKRQIKWLLAVSAIATMFYACSAHAQMTYTGSTNATEIAKSALQAKNFAVIPYIKYDLTSKDFGFGAAGMYEVTPNFWTGIRVDHIGNLNSTAGAQAQLKTDVTFAGITISPFIESSVGIGQSTMYGSAGTGGLVKLYSHSWTRSNQDSVVLNIGLIADYEHVVQTGSLEKNSNQINAGPLLNLSF